MKDYEYKIMFVCHGNICRSPMAEFIFKKMLDEEGLTDRVFVASSAVSTEEIVGGIGNPVYHPALRELKRHGIDPGDRRAVQLKKADYEEYDLFVVMDGSNMRGAVRIFGSDPWRKLCRMMDFTARGGDVADPWYTGDFSTTYRDIYDGCTGLMEHIRLRLSPNAETE